MRELRTIFDQRLVTMMQMVDSVVNQSLYVGDAIEELNHGQQQLERRLRGAGPVRPAINPSPLGLRVPNLRDTSRHSDTSRRSERSCHAVASQTVPDVIDGPRHAPHVRRRGYSPRGATLNSECTRCSINVRSPTRLSPPRRRRHAVPDDYDERPRLHFTARERSASRDDAKGKPSRRFTLPSHKFPEYEGLEKSGFIDDYIANIDNAVQAFNWDEGQTRYVVEAYIGNKPRGHLKTFDRSHIRTYAQVRKILLDRYGSHRGRDTVRNSFPHLGQVQGESTDDFLDRLLRDHRRGWPDATERERNTAVLNVFIHGLMEEILGESFELEYTKPAYMDNPPSPVELRNYIETTKGIPRKLLRMAGPPSSLIPMPSLNRGMPCKDTSTLRDQTGRPNQVKPNKDPHTPYQGWTPTPVIGAGYWATEPAIAPILIGAHREWWPRCLPQPRWLRLPPAEKQPLSCRVIPHPCTRTPTKMSTVPPILPRETEWAPDFIWGKLR